jgi:hypothetical protein
MDLFSVYTWDSSYPKKTKELGLRPLIMLWGGGDDKIQAFRAAVNNPDNAGSILLGFNECAFQIFFPTLNDLLTVL